MHKNSSDTLFAWLVGQIDGLQHGDRLPTVREIMRRHGVGQGSVQAALQRLKDQGLVSAQVGSGSYVVKPGSEGATPDGRRSEGGLKSLLILSNASMNERGVLVQNLIVEDVRSHGGRVVQLSYHDGAHLMEILNSTPSFDAAILQSHFERMPLRLLALLKQKTRALVVDVGDAIDRAFVDSVVPCDDAAARPSPTLARYLVMSAWLPRPSAGHPTAETPRSLLGVLPSERHWSPA